MQFTPWAIACAILVVVQAAFTMRVVARLIATANGSKIATSTDADPSCVSVIVPVLDEEHRLRACLEALRLQGPALAEVIVVDGGSVDATRDVVRTAALADRRLRLVLAPAPPAGWNGKAWNLHVGLREVDASCGFVATVDADVRVAPELVSSLVAHAARMRLRAFSVATEQCVMDALGGALHPSLLTTLVYRFGVPGTVTTQPRLVQANGQCFFAERALLVESDAIALSRASRCEDVTMARAIASSGTPVGFFEAASLAQTTMYADWRELIANWPRSLGMLDRYCGAAGWIGLLQVALVQALPLWALAALLVASAPNVLVAVEAGLVAMRLGVLAGTRRAYARVAFTYWLSPLVDALSIVTIVAAAVRRRHRWRGRMMVARAR